jgi:hypothetical protein
MGVAGTWRSRRSWCPRGRALTTSADGRWSRPPRAAGNTPGDRRSTTRRRVRRGARHHAKAARHNLTEICCHLEDIGALRDDVDARLATRTITYYYGIDGLLRTRDVFGWSLERSNQWLLAHASAAVLRPPSRL